MRIIIAGLLFIFAVSNYFELATGSDDSSPERYKSLNRDIYPKTRPLKINTSRREFSAQSLRSPSTSSPSTTGSNSPTPRRRLYPRHDGNGDIVEYNLQKRRFSSKSEKTIAPASQPLKTQRRPSAQENGKNVAFTNQPLGIPRRHSPLRSEKSVDSTNQPLSTPRRRSPLRSEKSVDSTNQPLSTPRSSSSTTSEKNVAPTSQPPSTRRRRSPPRSEKNVDFTNQPLSTPRRSSPPRSEKNVDSINQPLSTPRSRSSPGFEHHSFTLAQPGTSRISPSIQENPKNENHVINKDLKRSTSPILYYGTKNRILDAYPYPEYNHPRRPQGTIIIDQDKQSETQSK